MPWLFSWLASITIESIRSWSLFKYRKIKHNRICRATSFQASNRDEMNELGWDTINGRQRRRCSVNGGARTSGTLPNSGITLGVRNERGNRRHEDGQLRLASYR